MNPPETPEVASAESSSKKTGLLDTVRFILISLALVLGFRYFVAQPFIVSGDSMIPTFQDGDYLVVDEISYRFEKPSRGDVIILRYPVDPSKFFIKRIIGLPGETLSFNGSEITVTTTEGKKITLIESYVKNERSDFITVTLKDDEYYVLGDNRAASSDSRRWGPLPAGDIVGRPVIRLLPVSRISWTPGSANP